MSSVGQVTSVLGRPAEFAMVIEGLTKSIVEAGGRRVPSGGAQRGVMEELSDPDRIRKLTDAISEAIRNINARVGFGIYEETGRIYIKVLDRLSGALIKTIPPEEFLKLAAKMIQMRRALGLMVDVSK